MGVLDENTLVLFPMLPLTCCTIFMFFLLIKLPGCVVFVSSVFNTHKGSVYSFIFLTMVASPSHTLLLLLFPHLLSLVLHPLLSFLTFPGWRFSLQTSEALLIDR